MSSANRNNFANISLGKSFLNNINKMGPKTIPWGTPLITDAQSDNAEMTRTYCLLFDRKPFIQNN